jgi:hypothetical protein
MAGGQHHLGERNWQQHKPGESVGAEEVEDQRMTGEQALASSAQLSGGVTDGRYVDAPFPYAS